MDPGLKSLLLAVSVAVILVTAWRYFRRVRVLRPPVGVFNLCDVAFTFVVLLFIPSVYLTLPTWLVASILVLLGTGLVQLTVSPVLRSRGAAAVAGGLAAGELALEVAGYGLSPGFVALNDVAVGLLVVGVSNIWAQSGIRARDVAVFACAVGAFDLSATWLLPLMLDFFTRVHELPFAPTLAVGTGGGAALIGMGDLLFVVLWPLVAGKAFGGRAGVVAAAGTLGCVAAILVAFRVGVLTTATPAMVFVAPVILGQYLLYRRHYGVERTTGEYEGTAVPPPAPPVADLAAALALLGSGTDRPDRWLAVHRGRVIAAGRTPGAATRAARTAAPGTTPVIVFGIPPARMRPRR